MNDEEFNKHKENIENFIIEELILRVPGLINFNIHRLPKLLEKDTEYIFFIFDMDDDQKNALSKFIYSKLFEYYDSHDWDYDFLVVLVEY